MTQSESLSNNQCHLATASQMSPASKYKYKAVQMSHTTPKKEMFMTLPPPQGECPYSRLGSSNFPSSQLNICPVEERIWFGILIGRLSLKI
jgi:hypothetical protein